MRELSDDLLDSQTSRFKDEDKAEELRAANGADWTALIKGPKSWNRLERERAREHTRQRAGDLSDAALEMPWSEAPTNKRPARLVRRSKWIAQRERKDFTGKRRD